MSRWPTLYLLPCLVLGGFATAWSQSPPDVTVVRPDGVETLSAERVDSRDFVWVDDLERLFQLQRTGDDGTRLTLTAGGRAVIVTAGDRLVSVGGQLVRLRAEPRQSGGRWQVPLSFIGQALGPLLDRPIDLRPRERLVLLDGAQVPTVSARYDTDTGGAQLRVVLTPAADVDVEERDGQLHVTIDAPLLEVGGLPRPRDTIVTGLAHRAAPPGLFVGLGPDYEGFEVVRRPGRDGAAEVIIDLAARARVTDAAPPPDPAPPAVAPAPGGDPAPLPDLTAPRELRLVAIDAGHGGSDTGTTGVEGTLEKDVTLSVARRLREAIQNRLGLRVVLTRTADEDVDLDRRAAIANNNKADIFFSLHVNASVRPAASGAEVFFLSADEYGEAAREITEGQSSLVPVVGGGVRSIDLVQWTMAQVNYLDLSSHLARVVHDELGARIPMSARDVQAAPFRVLVGANMPAVLVELGFVSNPDDEQRLTSDRFQGAVVDALVASLERFQADLDRGLGRPADLAAATSEGS